MTKIQFVMEQHVGMQTFYKNMRQVVDKHEQISAEWIEIAYTKSLAITKNLNRSVNHLLGTGFGMLQARRGLIHRNADAIFFNTQVPALLAGRILKHTPYVLSTDITPIQYDAWSDEYDHRIGYPPFIERYKYSRNRICFQNAQKVIAWSSWTAGSLINDYHVNPAKVEVIPPGVDLDMWQPRVGQQEADKFNILFVGSDFKRKGGDLLVKAFRKLPSERFHLHLVTKAKVAEEKGISVYRQMRPNSAELLDLYQRAHVYVHPARAEAYGISAVEAVAVGLPVIVTRVGGLQSVVDDHISGYLLDEANPELIAQRIRDVVADDEHRQAMAFAARLRAEQFFDSEKNTQRVLTLIQAAAEGRTMPNALRVRQGQRVLV